MNIYMAYHRALEQVYRLIGKNSNNIVTFTKVLLDHRKKVFFKEATYVKTNDPAKLGKTVKSKITPNSNSLITQIISENKTLDSFVDISNHFAKPNK